MTSDDKDKENAQWIEGQTEEHILLSDLGGTYWIEDETEEHYISKLEDSRSNEKYLKQLDEFHKGRLQIMIEDLEFDLRRYKRIIENLQGDIKHLQENNRNWRFLSILLILALIIIIYNIINQ